MALRYSFDQGEEADRLEAAVEKVLADGVRTGDLMQADDAQPVSTSQMGDAILAALERFSLRKSGTALHTRRAVPPCLIIRL